MHTINATVKRLQPGAAALMIVLAAGCAVNPVTGERELALISEQQEVGMGRNAAEQVEQTLGHVADEDLQQYVERIGLALAADSERPDLPWQFRVVDDPTPNAFALPGGFIYITRGLLSLMDSEAELAAVLGHEIGHVTARHSVTQLSRMQLAQLGLGLGMILAPELQRFGDLAGTGLNILFLKHGRDDERQADELGFRYMLDNGYDVRQMADVFAALQSSSELAGRSPIPSWLASHPSEPERIEAVNARVASLGAPAQELRVGSQAYFEQLDGLVYGEDPRHGFFREGKFYHPELAFEFAVPQDWQTQNLTNMVVAASEAGDAALQLTVVGKQSPEDAARAFAAQSGAVIGASARQRLSGNPAVVSEFQAEAQGGVVRGYVTHVAHGELTYRLVAFAPAQRFGQRAEQLEQIAASFAPLRDRSVLDVEPRRIDVVQLDRAMTLEEFAAQQPSSIPLEELAVLNQVDDPDAMLSAGTRLKRVVGGPS